MFQLRLVLCSLAIFFSTYSWATGIESFHKHFELKRNAEGKLSSITSKDLDHRISFIKFTEQWIEIIGNADIILGDASGLTHGDISKFLDDKEDIELEEKSLRPRPSRVAKFLIRRLEEMNLPEVFKKEEVQKVLKLFEAEFLSFDLSTFKVLSKPDNSKYFYRQKILNLLSESGVKLVKQFITIPVAGDLVLGLIDQFISGLEEAKIYHQSILLYYLTNFSADELEITEIERQKAVSSLMESKIKWHQVRQHLKAKDDWQGYGQYVQKKHLRKSLSRAKKYRKKFAGDFKQLNNYFAYAKSDSQNYILNTYTRKSFFNSAPSVAFNFHNLNEITIQRTLLRLLDFSLDLIPFVPSTDFFKKRYEGQIKIEGHLFGHFENLGRDNYLEVLKKQTVNPILQLL